MKKIIQYPVRLPIIETGDLAQMLDADLDSLLPHLPQEDQQRLVSAWKNILSQYVRTPRDVRRLVNSFSVAVSGIGDYTDPVDLLILECFRLFEPAAYSYIRAHIAELWG